MTGIPTSDLLSKLPAPLRAELLDLARQSRPLDGGLRPFQTIIDLGFPLIQRLLQGGLSHSKIVALLAVVGIGRVDGAPYPVRTLSSALSRRQARFANLQAPADYCSRLQGTAVGGSELPAPAVECRTAQESAVRCSTVQDFGRSTHPTARNARGSEENPLPGADRPLGSGKTQGSEAASRSMPEATSGRPSAESLASSIETAADSTDNQTGNNDRSVPETQSETAPHKASSPRDLANRYGALLLRLQKDVR